MTQPHVHPHLRRQLRRAGFPADLDSLTGETVADVAISAESLASLLAAINTTYESSDRDRRLNDRAWEISSEEMQELHAKLEQASATELAVERDRLKTVLNTTRTGLCLVDVDHNIVEINAAGANFLGTQAAGALGTNVLKLLWPTRGRRGDQIPHELKVALTTSQQWHGELIELELSTGNRRACNIVFTPLSDNVGGAQGGLLAIHDLTEQHKAAADMAWRATHDPLTGLLNRAAFTSYVDGTISAMEPGDLYHAVLFIDLDHFKNINDTSGHDAGDTVLVEGASRIKSALRNSDVVARFGGDEFVVFLEEVPGPDSVSVVAERILAALRRPFVLTGQAMHLSASIGISVTKSSKESADMLLRDADIALYRAKAAGRDQSMVFGEDLRETLQRRVELDRELRRAVANQQLTVAFQPIVLLRTGQIVGFETLARWPTEEGFVGPDQFIPLAEENGLIGTIGEVVLREAVSLAGAIGAGAPSWPRGGSVVTVNVSGSQLARGEFTGLLARTLARARVPASAICLELTESSLVEHGSLAWKQLTDARKLGIHVALDDFGTGWSSLSVLQKFPINCIKIDRSFVDSMTSNPEDKAIVEAVTGLGATLRHQVIAEGVENTEQADALLEIGCELAQGYFYGRPMDRQSALAAFEESRIIAAASLRQRESRTSPNSLKTTIPAALD